MWVCLISSLAPLVSKVKEPQVETMVDTLCSNMMSDKEQLRDISSMGLKTVIAELPLTSSGEEKSHRCCQHTKSSEVTNVLLTITVLFFNARSVALFCVFVGCQV